MQYSRTYCYNSYRIKPSNYVIENLFTFIWYYNIDLMISATNNDNNNRNNDRLCRNPNGNFEPNEWITVFFSSTMP